MDDSSDVTLLLRQIEHGDANAAAQLLPLVYEQLRTLAAARMANERADNTLQATALVHEAWLRLGGDAQPAWRSRAHFFSAAAEAMRRILIDRARKRRASRHGGNLVRADSAELDLAAAANQDELLLALDDALERLRAIDAAKAELVKLRYFVGLNHEEAAATLGISVITAKRWWSYARAWLYTELQAR
jgi:RNA polymerase sigma factor (TIGR02999 family)